MDTGKNHAIMERIPITIVLNTCKATSTSLTFRQLLGERTAHEAFLVEDGVPPQLNHAPQGLKEDARVHLARSQHAVHKHDGYLLDPEAHAVGSELHLDLEGIDLELDGVQIDGLQHLPMGQLTTFTPDT